MDHNLGHFNLRNPTTFRFSARVLNPEARHKPTDIGREVFCMLDICLFTYQVELTKVTRYMYTVLEYPNQTVQT